MFSLTGAWEGAGTGRAGSGRKVSALAMSASISWRMRSRLVGRSEMRSLKGAARASFSSAALRLASLAACTCAVGCAGVDFSYSFEPPLTARLRECVDLGGGTLQYKLQVRGNRIVQSGLSARPGGTP